MQATNARQLTANQARVADHELCIGAQRWSLHDLTGLCIVGAGKASAAMARGLLESLHRQWPAEHNLQVMGQINVPEGQQLASQQIELRQVRAAGGNLPTPAAVAATREMVERISLAGRRDLCVVLISGGGSALLSLPVPGISLDDLVQVTVALSAAGCDIRQLNTVRQCLDAIKAGGLASYCRPEQAIALVLSDIIGDPLDLVASGPMLFSPRDTVRALEILATYDPQRMLPASVYNTLEKGCESDVGSGNRVPHVLIGNNQTAVAGAARKAKSLGYEVLEESCAPSHDVTEDAARLVQSVVAESGRKFCFVSGGEPTIRLAEPQVRGRGGRNQQLVLHALQLWQQRYSHVLPSFCFLSGGTDGEDGNTAVAGAWCDRHTHELATTRELQVDDFLRRNNAFEFFANVGGLLDTGATGTNVCDVRVFLCNGVSQSQ